jgi:biopolymer transport protein ExbB
VSGFFHDLARYVDEGGLVMLPLVLGALLLWLALGYRALLLRRGRARSTTALIGAWQRGERFTPLGVIDSAVARGLELLERRPEPLRRHLDDAFFELEQEIDRFSVLVQAIVVAAPLAGLFGTVTGMIETFDALGEMSLFSQSGGIAGGISQALITTQMGLAVAIPGLVVGRILKRRQARLQEELDGLKSTLCLLAAGGPRTMEVPS